MAGTDSDALLVAVFSDSLEVPSLYYPDKTSTLRESRYFAREVAARGPAVRFVARDFAPPADFFNALDTENVQKAFLFLESTESWQNLRSLRRVVRQLRSDYTDVCRTVLTKVQAEDEERAARKKENLQQQVKCIYEIVKKRDRELDDMQSNELQHIIADLIDKCQLELDSERKAAFAEMEATLYGTKPIAMPSNFFFCISLSYLCCVFLFRQAKTIEFEDRETQLMNEVSMLERELAEYGIVDQHVLAMLILAEVWQMDVLRHACLDYISRHFDTFADSVEWRSPLLQQSLSDLVDMVERNIDLLRNIDETGQTGSAATVQLTPRETPRTGATTADSAGLSVSPTFASKNAVLSSPSSARKFLDGFLSRRVTRQRTLEESMRRKAEQITLNKVLHVNPDEPAQKLTVEERLYRLRKLFQESADLSNLDSVEVDTDLPAVSATPRSVTPRSRAKSPRGATLLPEESPERFPYHAGKKLVPSTKTISESAEIASQGLRTDLLREHQSELVDATVAFGKEVASIRGEISGFLQRTHEELLQTMCEYSDSAARISTSDDDANADDEDAEEDEKKVPALHNFLTGFNRRLQARVIVDKMIQNARMVVQGRAMLSRVAIEPTKGLGNVLSSQNPKQRLQLNKTKLINPQSVAAERIAQLNAY
eukprot:TRINITY_DN396_c0_g1_i2.p1 TRINITY_DN396_c0_g1~~TRINITY_DN396_c0_g1_i2.p1  ORF type:complete len:710 (-),score=141.55 TRINITY_DN396_c0_g1_i2:34-2004(-)